MSEITAVKGFRDLFGNEAKVLDYVMSVFKEEAEKLNWNRVITPVLEKKELFCRSLGLETDIVSKEMFELIVEDNKETVCMRPEMTASCARIFLEQGWNNNVLYYIDQNFRKEKPQAGRFRQFWQGGVELIGISSIYAIIMMFNFIKNFLNRLQINYIIKINSIGKLENRQKYSAELGKYFEKNYNKLSKISQERFNRKAFLRILDSKEAEDQEIIKNSPGILSFISPESLNQFNEVKEFLKTSNINYVVNERLIRGLDYYQDIVFEIESLDMSTALTAICGGGDYSGLFEILGSSSKPAIGFAFGLDRVASVINKSILPQEKNKVLILPLVKNYQFVDKILSTSAIKYILDVNLYDGLNYAIKNNYDYLLIIGEESLSDKFFLKNLATREQKTYSLQELLVRLDNLY